MGRAAHHEQFLAVGQAHRAVTVIVVLTNGGVEADMQLLPRDIERRGVCRPKVIGCRAIPPAAAAPAATPTAGAGFAAAAFAAACIAQVVIPSALSRACLPFLSFLSAQLRLPLFAHPDPHQATAHAALHCARGIGFSPVLLRLDALLLVSSPHELVPRLCGSQEVARVSTLARSREASSVRLTLVATFLGLGVEALHDSADLVIIRVLRVLRFVKSHQQFFRCPFVRRLQQPTHRRVSKNPQGEMREYEMWAHPHVVRRALHWAAHPGSAQQAAPIYHRRR